MAKADPDIGPTKGQFYSGLLAFILSGILIMKKLVNKIWGKK